MKKKILIISIIFIIIATTLGAYLQLGRKNKRKEPPSEIKPASLYNWPMLGRDPAHSGFSDSEAPDGNDIFLRVSIDADKSNIERDVRGLVFEYGNLYFGFDGYVYALDASTGDVLWQTDLGSFIKLGEEEEISGLAVGEGKVFVSKEKTLHALDATTGEKLWSYSTGGGITAPTVANGKVYFGSDDDYLYAVFVAGELAWKFKTKGNIHCLPAVSDDKVCFGTEDEDWSVYCLNALNGEVSWRRQFAAGREGGGMFHAPPAIYNNLVFIGEEGGGRGIRTSGVAVKPAPSNFYALDINTGDVVWQFLASDWIVTAPAVAYQKVYFSSWDGNLYALNIADGKLIWKGKGGFAPAVADGKVFAGSPYSAEPGLEKVIFAYNAENGELVWRYQTEDIPAHLIVAAGKLYAGFTSEEAVHYQIIGFGQK